MSKKTKTNAVPSVQTEVITEAPETAEAVVEEVKAEVKAEQPKPSLIYLGPSIQGVVRHANVFGGGNLSKALQTIVNEMPAIKLLIVPVDEAPALVKSLNKTQSAAANVYKAVAQKYNKN